MKLEQSRRYFFYS